jgi:D-galacturonate reductase
MNHLNALMIGTGEYTTGYVHRAAAASDKSAGVVALTLFDLRRRGRVADLMMAGTNGTKFPGIREHLRAAMTETYRDLDVGFQSFPPDDVVSDPDAYQAALENLSPGDVVTVFTPDDTHFDITMAAVRKRCHVLVAKPIVKTLADHLALMQAAEENGVLVAMEVHKRWDPMYADARDRIRTLGEFSFFSAYMSQPKTQLDTFRAWAGKSSDISYYLNAHHIDFSVWAVAHSAVPRTVYASAATGYARGQGVDTEDTITLTVTWENVDSGNLATAVYTSSWIAPPSDVHSQQRFFYLGHDGEVQIDQAHRGYTVATDTGGLASVNPLFMKYAPDDGGYFAGQDGYGYRSIEDFVNAALAIRAGEASADDFRGKLATCAETTLVTAILEAGRRSLDDGGRVYEIVYDGTLKRPMDLKANWVP